MENKFFILEDMSVMFVVDFSGIYNDTYTKHKLHEAIAGVTGTLAVDYIYFTPELLHKYINDYFGKSLVAATGEDIERIRLTGEIDDMGNFPEYDSVRIIDGVMVVKLYEPDWE